MLRRYWCLALLIVVGSLLLAPQALATNYFVSSSTGSDSNPGTQALPWQSLSKVNSFALAPGDQVEFLRGDTWTGGLNLTHAGNTGARISFFGYGANPNRPKITGGLSGNCITVNTSFVTIDNLWLENCGYAGVATKGTDTTVQNSMLGDPTVSDPQDSVGVQVATGGTNVLITGNTIVNNNVLNVNNSSGSSGAFGVLCNAACIVSNNTISGSDASSIAYGRDGSAVELFNAGNAWVHNNVMTDNNTGVEAGGTDAGAAVEYNKITSNQASDTQAEGTVWAGSAGNLWFSHNSVDVIGATTQGIVCFSSCTAGTTITSNAVKATQKSIYVDSTTPAITGNVFNGPTQTGTALDPSNSTATILWTAPPSDLTEQAASPTVDHATVTNFAADLAGNPVPDVAGTASDSGAYEFGGTGGGGDTTPPSTPTGLNVTGQTQTSLTLNWTASTDNVGVTGYDTFLNGVDNGNVTTTSKTYTGLACGTTYTLGVQAFDAAGNKSGTATAQGTTSACTTGGGAPTHVVVIAMENQDYNNIYNQSCCGFETGFANAGVLDTHYYATGHFSLDNYITVTSGQIGVGNNDSCLQSGSNNIFNQLGSGNAINYEESGFACRHAPASQYSDLNSSYQAPLPGTFDANTFNAKYTFITPNDTDNGHNTGAATGDNWLSGIVPRIKATPQYTSGSLAIVIWYDESNVNDVQGNTTPPDNHVYLAINRQGLTVTQDATQFTHCSLLGTIEDIFGQARLGCAVGAGSMHSDFGF